MDFNDVRWRWATIVGMDAATELENALASQDGDPYDLLIRLGRPILRAHGVTDVDRTILQLMAIRWLLVEHDLVLTLNVDALPTWPEIKDGFSPAEQQVIEDFLQALVIDGRPVQSSPAVSSACETEQMRSFDGDSSKIIVREYIEALAISDEAHLGDKDVPVLMDLVARLDAISRMEIRTEIDRNKWLSHLRDYRMLLSEVGLRGKFGSPLKTRGGEAYPILLELDLIKILTTGARERLLRILKGKK